MTGVEFGINEGLLHRQAQAAHQVLTHGFKIPSREASFDVFGTFFRGGDEGEVDIGHSHAAEFDFRFFRRFRETLQGLAIAPQVDSFRFEKSFGQPIDDFAIEIVAPQLGIATGRSHLKYAVPDIEDRYVKGSPSQIENQNRLRLPPF